MKKRTIRSTLFFLPAILLIATWSLTADYIEGKKIFEAKCSSCHSGYVPADKLKENFFQKENTLLKLKAPTVNMLAWAIMEGPRKIGDPNDEEMRQAEIEEYLRESLEHPDPTNSICDNVVMKYYEKKEPIKGISDKELADLASYLMEYKKYRLAHSPKVKRKLTRDMDVRAILAEAKKSGRTIIIEATSPTCHYCKKMEREVIDTPDIRQRLAEGFILVEVNVDDTRLPLGLDRVYQQITPSFFFLSPEGKLLDHFPGSWNKNDFAMMLEQYRAKNVQPAR